MVLNERQQEFVNYVIKNYKNNGMVLLNASAGTGKTFLAKHIIKEITKKKGRVKVVAPTNKAVNVLMKHEIYASTIHRFLNAVSKYKDNGKVYFEFSSPFFVNHIIIVDECSMITNEMFERFRELSTNNYLIFMGDDLQLPPINAEEFDENDVKIKVSKLSPVFNITPKFTLTKNMRSLEITSNLYLEKSRESVYKKQMPSVLYETSIKDMLRKFMEDEDTIIVSFSNISVNNYNKIVREHKFKKTGDELEKYYEGEVLFFSNGMRKIGDDKYYSGDKVRIQDLETEYIEIEYIGCDHPQGDNKNKCNICGKKINPPEMINFYKITDQNNNTWYKPIDLYKFMKVKKDYKNYAIERKTSNTWKGYYDWLNRFDADLKYSYAMTIHKSQGSEFKNVFVDRNNLIRSTSQDLLLKLHGYYTAISRMITFVSDIKK
jgi:ATP-dependent exoDNAse (exonuclease V) alpha subunit